MRTSLLVLSLAGTGSLTAALPTLKSRSALQLPSLESLNLSKSASDLLSSHIASLPEVRKIRTSADEDAFEVTEGDKVLLTAAGVHFKDVTDYPEEWVAGGGVALAKRAETYPTTLRYSKAKVASINARSSTSQLTSWMSTFTGYTNRYYRSTYGVQAQGYLLSLLQSIAGTSTAAKVTVTQFTHSWGQNSIIVKMDAATPAATNAGVVILGAHLDSINGGNPTNGRAPGADDNASGALALVSAFSSLASSGYVPADFAVEFHFYAGEEGGLLGSAAIAKSYATAKRRVRGMINFDMAAWTSPGYTRDIEFVTDYVNTALTDYSILIAKQYTDVPIATQKCGYACSDHASWTDSGFPSSNPFEGTIENPVIHSAGDISSVNGFSYTQILEFVKLAVGFTVELAGGL